MVLTTLAFGFLVMCSCLVEGVHGNSNTNEMTRNKRRSLRPLATGATSRIIGGVDATRGRFPYNVALVDDFENLICGGVLVAPDVVLTVGHCEGDSKRAQIGRYNRAEVTEDFDDLRIDSHRKHPFQTGEGPFEFDLMKLSGSSSKSYVRLNSDPNLPKEGIESGLTAVGFGVTKFEAGEVTNFQLATFLQQVSLTYMPNEECEKSKDPDSPEEHMKWVRQNEVGSSV